MHFLTTLMLLSLLVFPHWCAAAAANPTTKASMPGLFLLLLDEITEPVAFTFTTVAGQFNTLPAGATGVRLTCRGQTLSRSTSPLTFTVPLGATAFTAEAMNGGTTVATMGPIQLTVVKGFPLTIPLAFTAFPAFDTFHTDVGLDTPNTLIYFGTANRDRVVQYGRVANDLLSVDMGAVDDWSEQYGGYGDDTMIAEAGSGNDFIRQDGGNGDDNLTASGGSNDDWVIQDGYTGNNTLNLLGGDGNDHLEQKGGYGNDFIRVASGSNNDTIAINGGDGNDTITYDVDPGTDTATIDGGDGTDTLTVNNSDNLPILIRDSTLHFIYGATGTTTISVTGIEQITVTGAGGTPAFTWP